jgi:hypothetical protein
MMWVTYYCIEVTINRHKMKYYGTHQSIRLTLPALVFEVSAGLEHVGLRFWAYLKLEKYSRLIERLNTSKLKTHFVSIGVHSLSLTWTCWIEILWAYLKLEKYSSLIERLTTSKLKTHTKFRRYPTSNFCFQSLPNFRISPLSDVHRIDEELGTFMWRTISTRETKAKFK